MFCEKAVFVNRIIYEFSGGKKNGTTIKNRNE